MQTHVIRKGSGPLVPVMIWPGMASGVESILDVFGDAAEALADLNNWLLTLVTDETDSDEQALQVAWAEEAVGQELMPGVMLCGVGRGAEAALHFATQHAERVAGCAVLSAEAWNELEDASTVNQVRWLVGCCVREEAERMRRVQRFQVGLAEAGADVDVLDWDAEAGELPGHVVENVLHFFADALAVKSRS